MITRKQHYVWRYYLEGWGQSNEQVFCMTNGKVITTNPSNIMAKRDFYKLNPFTAEDVQLFQHYLTRIDNPEMRKLAQYTFDIFHNASSGYEILQRLETVSDGEMSQAQSVVIEAEENLHAAIENGAVPIIDQLRRENLDFLNDEDSSIHFFNFVAHQYFRTKKMRDRIGEVLAEIDPRHDFSRLRHVFGHCFADDFGGSLFGDREKLEISFLKNQSVGFITGDQPIVNLAYKENMKHDDVAIYYPLRSDLAVVLSFRHLQLKLSEISNEVAKGLNETIAFNSNQFLVGPSKELLGEFINKPPERPDVLSLME